MSGVNFQSPAKKSFWNFGGYDHLSPEYAERAKWPSSLRRQPSPYIGKLDRPKRLAKDRVVTFSPTSVKEGRFEESLAREMKIEKREALIDEVMSDIERVVTNKTALTALQKRRKKNNVSKSHSLNATEKYLHLGEGKEETIENQDSGTTEQKSTYKYYFNKDLSRSLSLQGESANINSGAIDPPTTTNAFKNISLTDKTDGNLKEATDINLLHCDSSVSCENMVDDGPICIQDKFEIPETGENVIKDSKKQKNVTWGTPLVEEITIPHVLENPMWVLIDGIVQVGFDVLDDICYDEEEEEEEEIESKYVSFRIDDISNFLECIRGVKTNEASKKNEELLESMLLPKVPSIDDYETQNHRLLIDKTGQPSIVSKALEDTKSTGISFLKYLYPFSESKVKASKPKEKKQLTNKNESVSALSGSWVSSWISSIFSTKDIAHSQRHHEDKVPVSLPSAPSFSFESPVEKFPVSLPTAPSLSFESPVEVTSSNEYQSKAIQSRDEDIQLNYGNVKNLAYKVKLQNRLAELRKKLLSSLLPLDELLPEEIALMMDLSIEQYCKYQEGYNGIYAKVRGRVFRVLSPSKKLSSTKTKLIGSILVKERKKFEKKNSIDT